MADVAPSQALPTNSPPPSQSTTSSASSSSSSIPNDPSETGYDPTLRWRNYFNVLTNRMTPRGQLAMREDAYIRNEASDITRCEEWRDWLFTYSPTIIFLRQQIRLLNGELDEENVLCRRCPTRIDEEGRVRRQGGGFSAGHGILICANEMRSRGHLEDTLAHEMVHAWDSLRWKVKEGDLRHAACTEIRASALSGECRWTREFFTRSNWSLTQQHQNCVRSRAVQSVMNRPNCKDDVQAVKVVNEVWDSCYNDTRPFEEIYR